MLRAPYPYKEGQILRLGLLPSIQLQWTPLLFYGLNSFGLSVINLNLKGLDRLNAKKIILNGFDEY